MTSQANTHPRPTKKANLAVYVTDAGSVSKGKFHWVSSGAPDTASNKILDLVSGIAVDIRSMRQVAIGFECPQFVPCPMDSKRLGTARCGEVAPEFGSRPFNAAAGACVAMTGFQALAWVLRALRNEFPAISATTRWEELMDGRCQLFLWEAFVSGSEKGRSHHEDALFALRAFQKNVDSMATASRVFGEHPISLAGTLILWAGLSSDLSLLQSPSIVLRPIFEKQEADSRQRIWKNELAEKRRKRGGKNSILPT